MLRLFVATSNPGKLRDFAVAAETSDVLLQPLPGLKEITPPPEDEPTFEGNARAKAEYYSRFAPGEIVLADDSGLEVDALHGEPGVRSARFAADAAKIGEQGSVGGNHNSEDQQHRKPLAGADTDMLNNLYLLERLRDVSVGQRQARYRCVLAAAREGHCLFMGEGTVEGEILTGPQGEGGFGYDPLFYLPALAKTMAEIDLAAKHQISHRGRALRDLLARIAANAI